MARACGQNSTTLTGGIPAFEAWHGIHVSVHLWPYFFHEWRFKVSSNEWVLICTSILKKLVSWRGRGFLLWVRPIWLVSLMMKCLKHTVDRWASFVTSPWTPLEERGCLVRFSRQNYWVGMVDATSPDTSVCCQGNGETQSLICSLNRFRDILQLAAITVEMTHITCILNDWNSSLLSNRRDEAEEVCPVDTNDIYRVVTIYINKNPNCQSCREWWL